MDWTEIDFSLLWWLNLRLHKPILLHKVLHDDPSQFDTSATAITNVFVSDVLLTQECSIL